MTNPKESALSEIGRLVAEHSITLADIETAIFSSEAGEAQSNPIVRVLSYIGGTFVFAGIAIYIALQWQDMNSAMRVIISLGTGISLFVMAALAAKDDRYKVAAQPLFMIAAILQPTGLMVAFDEFGAGGDPRVAALITFGIFGVQYVAATIRTGLPLLAMVAAGFLSAAWALLLDVLAVEPAAINLSLGSAWICLGLGLRRHSLEPITPLIFFSGCCATLFATWDLVGETPIELAFLLAACAFVYLGVWAKSRTLNFTASLAILGYTSYYTATHFADSIGWPIALVLIGGGMIAIGLIALRIDQRYLRG